MDGETTDARGQHVVLSVFWEGTAHQLGFTQAPRARPQLSKSPTCAQIGRFAFSCGATDITEQANTADSTGPFKMQFHGCGVTHGCAGVLLMSGLRDESRLVKERVEGLISQGFEVQVNAIGQSRGGVACVFLAQALAQLNEPDKCRLSLLLFDAVPGVSEP